MSPQTSDCTNSIDYLPVHIHSPSLYYSIYVINNVHNFVHADLLIVTMHASAGGFLINATIHDFSTRRLYFLRSLASTIAQHRDKVSLLETSFSVSRDNTCNE